MDDRTRLMETIMFEVESMTGPEADAVSPETALRTAAAWAYSDERTLLAHACLNGADTIADLVKSLREARGWVAGTEHYGGIEVLARIDAALKKAGG